MVVGFPVTSSLYQSESRESRGNFTFMLLFVIINSTNHQAYRYEKTPELWLRGFRQRQFIALERRCLFDTVDPYSGIGM